MWRALVLPNGLLFNDKHANDGQCAKLKDTNDIINAAGTFQICFSFTWKSFFFSLLDIEYGRNKNKTLFLERDICFLCASEKLCDFGFFMDTDRYTLPEVGIHVCVMIHEDKAKAFIFLILSTSGSNQLQLHLIHSSVSSNLSADADQRQFLQRQTSFIFCPRTDTDRKVTSVLLLGSSSIVNVIYTSLTVYL